ncbi:hypothetical protein MMC09_005304 [Bachmanniomyces sp. S44760]|nr:hypothetical protein [Bachmanniomyces sp. S44760]
MQLPTDVRLRLEPKLPRDYIGNAPFDAGPVLPIQDLLGSKEDALSHVARTIRDAISGLNHEKISGIIDTIDTTYSSHSLDQTFDFNGADLMITSFAQMEMYDHHWGKDLGQLEGLRMFPIGADGRLVILPKDREGGMEILMSLEEQAIERLKGMEEFTAFVDFRCDENSTL